MRRLLLSLALVSIAAAASSPALLREYVQAYRAYSADIRTITNAVQARCPRTFYIADDFGEVLGVADTVLRTAEPGTTINEFDYESLDGLMDKLDGLLDPATTLDRVAKTVRTPRGLLSSKEFTEAVTDFTTTAAWLASIAGRIRTDDPAFLPEYDALRGAGDIPSYQRWYEVKLAVKAQDIQRRLDDFEARYGDLSDRLNWLEYLLTRAVPCLRGSDAGPSHWEPILRLSSVTLNVADAEPNRAVQAGVNYYFLSEEPGLLRKLNHIGLAATLVDTSGTLIGVTVGTQYWTPGLFLHLGRYQAGIMAGNGWQGLKFVTTFDFQLLPTFF
jgi:hypothetical protein